MNNCKVSTASYRVCRPLNVLFGRGDPVEESRSASAGCSQMAESRNAGGPTSAETFTRREADLSARPLNFPQLHDCAPTQQWTMESHTHASLTRIMLMKMTRRRNAPAEHVWPVESARVRAICKSCQRCILPQPRASTYKPSNSSWVGSGRSAS